MTSRTKVLSHGHKVNAHLRTRLLTGKVLNQSEVVAVYQLFVAHYDETRSNAHVLAAAAGALSTLQLKDAQP